MNMKALAGLISPNDHLKKRPGRPATGRAPMVGVRMSEELQEEVRVWADKQDGHPPLATAVRRLVEVGLTVRTNHKRRAPAERLVRANEMASQAIDNLVDSVAPAKEKANRKSRLQNGPEEFREARLDLSKPKATRGD
jgi:hypothetical protein